MPTLIVVLLVIFALYVLVIMPRMTKKPDESAFDCKFFAHRGLHDNATDAPENSIKAFAKAIENGYGMELDVQMSKDGVPVVFHDFTLKRVCGREGKVKDYTLAELQQMKLCNSEETIPTFADFLELVHGQVPLIIEYKIELSDLSVCKKADEMLRKYKGVYCIESFNPIALVWYRCNHPDVMRGQLSDAFMHDKTYWMPQSWWMVLLQFLVFNFATKPDFIAYNCEHPNNPSRMLCHAFFRNKAAAWTVRSDEQYEKVKNKFDVFIFDSYIPKRQS